MNTSGAIQNGMAELSSTDANIPLLAIEAANELDELVEGRHSSLESVARLAEILKRSFRLDQAGGRHQSFVDSGTVAVFSQAIDGSAAGERISSIDDLVARAVEIVDALEKSAAGNEGQSLKKMRDFCIALSKAAAAYQQSVYEMRPSHPFRT